MDKQNLMSLCKDCHGAIHSGKKNDTTPEEMLDILEELMKDVED